MITKDDLLAALDQMMVSGFGGGKLRCLIELADIDQHEESLRDRFAMAALTGICSNPEWRNRIGESFAHAAYELADEMLAEKLVSMDKQDEPNPS